MIYIIINVLVSDEIIELIKVCLNFTLVNNTFMQIFLNLIPEAVTAK